MSDHKHRIDTIKTILTGSPEIGNSSKYSVILSEFNRVISAKRVTDVNQKRILQILYSTRALDSSLETFIRRRSSTLHPAPIPPSKPTLGNYLSWLTDGCGGRITKLPNGSKGRYKENIVKPRNRYMHQAGAFPSTEIEIDKLLSEMHACLSEVIAL